MKAIMVVLMNISNESWINDYFATVPALLAEYGAVQVAGGRNVMSIEGETAPPDRIAVIEFPSREAVYAAMADSRYDRFQSMRQSGSSSHIFLFDNAATIGSFV